MEIKSRLSSDIESLSITKAEGPILHRASSDDDCIIWKPSEAAKYLGIAEATLEVWRCTKRYPIPYIKVGSLVRYRKVELDHWLLSRTVNILGDQQ